MGLVIQRVGPNHFSKELLKYIFMKVIVYIHDFVLLRIFYEGVACTIKSWDIIYR